MNHLSCSSYNSQIISNMENFTLMSQNMSTSCDHIVQQLGLYICQWLKYNSSDAALISCTLATNISPRHACPTRQLCTVKHARQLTLLTSSCLDTDVQSSTYLIIFRCPRVERPSQKQLCHNASQRPHVYSFAERQSEDDFRGPDERERKRERMEGVRTPLTE